MIKFAILFVFFYILIPLGISLWSGMNFLLALCLTILFYFFCGKIYDFVLDYLNTRRL